MSDRARTKSTPQWGGHGGGGRFLSERVRPKSAAKTLRRLAALFRPHLWTLVGIVAFVSVSACAALVVPWIVGRVIDEVVAGRTVNILSYVEVLAGVYLVDAAVTWINTRTLAGLSQRVVTSLRKMLFTSLADKPLAVFDRRERGDLMSRMANDIDNVATGLAQSGLQLIGAAIGISGSLVLMLIFSGWLTLASLATVPLIFLLSGLVSRRTRGFFRAQQASLGALNAHMEEAVGGFLEIKAFHRDDDVVQRFHKYNQALRTNGTKAQIWAGLVMPLMNVINNLGLGVLALVGGFLCLQGRATVGLIASFVGYSRQFGRPLNDVANSWNVLQAAFAGAERVFEILDEAPEAADDSPSQALDAPRGKIVLERVTFGYHPDQPVLKDVDLIVEPGETVALVGATGSGKTTLVQLLLRFYEVTGGRILLDDRPLNEWTRASVRRAFGVVLQDAWLFQGTLAANIRYGKPEATDDQVRHAAEAANASSFIERLPDQYETLVESGGGSLSQGQRQLVTIARALLADAPFLLLDEATSNIDTRTEFRLQEALIRLMRGRTCFIIAHRLSTIRDADKIVLIDQGRVVESGTHDELVAHGGQYAQMYHSSLTKGVSARG